MDARDVSRTGPVAILATLIAVVLAAGVVSLRRDPHALVPADGGFEAGGTAAPVGEVWYFGTGPIHVKPGHRVRFEGASVLGLPPGLDVVSIDLHSSADGKGSVGALPEYMYLRHDYRATPVPSPVVVGGQPLPYWEFFIALKATAPGHYATTGVRVRYREGGRKGHADYPYAYAITTL
jgi:hypothetical protein